MTEGNSPGYEALQNVSSDTLVQATFSPNSAYEEYLRIHKVFVQKGTADYLVDIAETLSHEELPRYLCAAGSAAVEAALVEPDKPTRQRLRLLELAQSTWKRAIDAQLALNTEDKEYYYEPAAPYRTALDIASLPLLRGIVVGDVTDKTCRNAFVDCLRVAQANAVQLNLAAREGDVSTVSEHSGFGYECNALLALNRVLSNGWFAVPALARADTGYHHKTQTHDLIAIRQKRGAIKNVIPVEIKSAASVRDRNRFDALLVRGKMHLSVEGGHTPEVTLAAIAATYEGIATDRQQATARAVTDRFMRMLKDYYAGGRREDVATLRTITSFHDKSLVLQNHPGLSPLAA